MTKRFYAFLLLLCVFQWSMLTDAPAQIMRFMMSTTTAIAQGVGTVASGLANQLAYYAANGTTVQGLATANNGVLVTSAGGVPSISSSLPSALTIPTPTLTGVPTAPTAVQSTNSAQVATTQFVKSQYIPLTFSWPAGLNPNCLELISNVQQPLTIQAIVGRLETPEGAAATIAFRKFASGTACSAANGTALQSGTSSINLNGTAATNTSLTPANATLAVGDTVAAITTGSFTTNTGSVTFNVTPQ